MNTKPCAATGPLRGSRSVVVLVAIVALVVAGGWLLTTSDTHERVTSRREAKIDQAAVLAAFRSPDPTRVKLMLARIRGLESPPIAWLVAQLGHTERGVREWSAHALGDAAPADEHVVQALLGALEDKDDLVRWKVVRALGRIGPPASTALRRLEPIAASEQEHEVVRATAQRALELIRRASETPRPE